jgi:hypothetical protein
LQDHGVVSEQSCTAPAEVCPRDHLYLPHRKRLSHGYVTNEQGARELCIYYGHLEVNFDEERLFPFGEALVSQSSFIAESATSWGPGYPWEEVRTLLATLVDEGIIKRGNEEEDLRGTGLVPSLVPPSVCPRPRFWSAAECEEISQDLGGRRLEIGNLEAVIPSYRVAHAALDQDGRQVGEANVFPPGLRLERATEWRVCQYSGSRYRDNAPMNLTALKAMIKHWKPVMKAVRAVRAEVKGRLPRSQDAWTVGDLHSFARVALSVPAYALLLGGGRAPQPPLHPVLSSMFRIIDGIRMTTHDMLFLSAERTRSPSEPITSADLYEFAERNGLFLSEYGVCAGPKAMMEEFFSVVFEGAAVEGEAQLQHAPEVEALFAALPAAVDYGFLGLSVWAVSRSVWSSMSNLYRELVPIFESSVGDEGVGARLRAHVRQDWEELGRERLALELERDVHTTVYADAYDQSWRALREPVGLPRFPDVVAPVAMTADHRRAVAALTEIFAAHFPDAEVDGEPLSARLATSLVSYLREEQAVLAGVAALQEAINRRLDRPRPKRALTVRDFHSLFAMSPSFAAQFPYVVDRLGAELGFHIECSATDLEVSKIG